MPLETAERRLNHATVLQIFLRGRRLFIAAFLLVVGCICLILSAALLFLSAAPYGFCLNLARLATGSPNPLNHEQYSLLLPRMLPGGLFYGALGVSLLFLRRRLTAWITEAFHSLHSCFTWYGQVIALTFRTETLVHWASLSLILLFGIVLRLGYLNEPPRYDESATYVFFAGRSLAHVLTLYPAPNNHILHSLLVWASCRIFGNAPWALRIPVLLAGVLLIPLIYAVARRFGGRNAALYAAGFTAVSGPFILYSVNARGYMLQAIFFLLMLYWAEELASQSAGGSWILFSAAAIAGFWTAPTMLYPYLVAAGWLLWRGRFRVLRPLVISGALTAVVVTFLYMPVLIVSGPKLLLANPWVRPLTRSEFGTAMSRFPADLFSFLHGSDMLLVPVLLVLGVLLCFLISRARDGARLFLLVLLVLVIVAPLQRVVPFPRILLPLCTVYYLSGALGWSALGRRLSARLDLPVLVALTLLLSTAAYSLTHSGYIEAQRSFELGPQVAQFLARQLRPCDRLIPSESAGPPLEYELKRAHVRWTGYSDREPLFGRVYVPLSRISGPLPKAGNGLVDPSALTLEGTLRLSHLDTAKFTPPRLIYSYRSAEVFELEPLHAPDGAAGACPGGQ